jgi:hypothetical protein
MGLLDHMNQSMPFITNPSQEPLSEAQPKIASGKLVNCRDCEQPISVNAYVCPHCGLRLKISSCEQLARLVLGLISVALALGVLVGLFSLLMHR